MERLLNVVNGSETHRMSCALESRVEEAMDVRLFERYSLCDTSLPHNTGTKLCTGDDDLDKKVKTVSNVETSRDTMRESLKLGLHIKTSV